jgi:transposase
LRLATPADPWPRRPSARERAKAQADAHAERKIRAALASDPAMSAAAIARRCQVSVSTASKWARVVKAERGQSADKARTRLAQ